MIHYYWQSFAIIWVEPWWNRWQTFVVSGEKGNSAEIGIARGCYVWTKRWMHENLPTKFWQFVTVHQRSVWSGDIMMKTTPFLLFNLDRFLSSARRNISSCPQWRTNRLTNWKWLMVYDSFPVPPHTASFFSALILTSQTLVTVHHPLSTIFDTSDCRTWSI